MATVNKRPSGKWQATVRRDGTSQSRSFGKRADAMTWARETELRAERGGLHDTTTSADSAMSLGQVLERYCREVTSTKLCAENETYAIGGFLRSCPKLATTDIGKLTIADFTSYRDRRLQKMKPATVVRELGWMQHAIDIACSDWGQNVRGGNPVKLVRRPRIHNRRERRLQEGEWQALLDAVNEVRTPLMKPLL